MDWQKIAAIVGAVTLLMGVLASHVSTHRELAELRAEVNRANETHGYAVEVLVRHLERHGEHLLVPPESR